MVRCFSTNAGRSKKKEKNNKGRNWDAAQQGPLMYMQSASQRLRPDLMEASAVKLC